MPGLIAWKRSDIASMRNRMEELFDEFFGELADRSSLSVADLFLNWKVIEEEGRFVVQIDLPNMSRSDIDVHLEQDVLTIRARTGSEAQGRPAAEHGENEGYGIVGSIRLPRFVDKDGIQASYVQNVLEIVLPRKKAPPFKIELKD
jgi:HSP20 family protein